MRAIEITGDRHQFPAAEPGEDHAGIEWARCIAMEWADELRDTRQDIYTIEDAQPMNVSRLTRDA